MPKQHACIAQTVIGAGGTNSVTFSSIPNTYTDLLLVMSVRSSYNAVGSGISIRFNSSSTGYSYRQLYGYSGGAGTFGQTSVTAVNLNTRANTADANVFSPISVYIPNAFAAVSKLASIEGVDEDDGTTNWQQDMFNYMWDGTDAISSITIFENNSVNLVQHSTITLYGIVNS